MRASDKSRRWFTKKSLEVLREESRRELRSAVAKQHKGNNKIDDASIDSDDDDDDDDDDNDDNDDNDGNGNGNDGGGEDEDGEEDHDGS